MSDDFEVVQEALGFLERHIEGQPNDGTVALTALSRIPGPLRQTGRGGEVSPSVPVAQEHGRPLHPPRGDTR